MNKKFYSIKIGFISRFKKGSVGNYYRQSNGRLPVHVGGSWSQNQDTRFGGDGYVAFKAGGQ